MPGTTVPTEDELKEALSTLRAENPTLGIPKLHALLSSTHPDWSVSEKRTRKVVQSAGLTVAPPGGSSASRTAYPKSSVIKDLDIAKWTTKVEVRNFGKEKGKGLVAKEEIGEGDVIWKEDPWVIGPEWEIYDLQRNGRACAFCTTPLNIDSRLIVNCPDSTSASFCPGRFCSRLCLQRSAVVHPLLCPSKNPASAPLLAFARSYQWMALQALAHCTAKILLANQQDEKVLENDWKLFSSFAELGMEDRMRDLRETWSAGEEFDKAAWKKAHQLIVHAFKEPPLEANKKKLAKILKKPLPDDIDTKLFDYDATLHNLGRMSLNLESHGGLYTLHSHLNHSCAPNVSVRHLDQRSALARITVIARQTILPGQELTISYVNPELPLPARRRRLGDWGFGKCTCERCLKEEKELQEKEGEMTEKEREEKRQEDELAKELKEGLGVV